MPTLQEPQLVNLMGHSAGAIIFAIFLFLMFRDRSGTRLRGSWLSVAAGTLAFLWNAGSLAVLLTASVSPVRAEWMAFFSFSVLSLLPAVLLNISLDGSFSFTISLGYGLSVIAVCMHLLEIFHPAAGYHERALLLITIGFGILTAISVIRIAFQGHSNTRLK